MVSCLMGDSTALASAIVRCCLKNLETVDGETPAAAATSRMVFFKFEFLLWRLAYYL